jgi:hypothetical protein
MILSRWEYHILSGYDTSGGYKKNNNRQLSVSPINDFGQQCIKGIANLSAIEGGQVLPLFEHIVSGVSMLPCPIVAVF